jgi:tetratricopeptide (TPR) repeat protein
LQRGRLGEALADFRSAAAIVDPQMDEKEQAAEHAVDLVESGKILLLRKEYEAAQKVFEQALVLRPRMPDACLYRAKALLDMPCATEAEHVACYEQAVRSLDDYLRDGGKPSVEVYLTQAQVLTRLQKYEGAVEAYTLALALEPNNAAIRAARGWQHLATHARALARKDFDRAIQLDPRNVNAYNGRAQLRVTGEEYEQAVADAETALRLGGETAPLLCDAARTYALAMNQLDIERSKLPPLTPRSKIDANVRQRAAYGKRAVALLSRALASLPAADRPAFWRERVLGDKALEPVRRSEEFAPLKGRYAGLGAELRKNG